MIVSIPCAWPQLTVTDDTYVSGATPTTANGSSTALVVQGGTGPSYTFMKFDLRSLTQSGVTGTEVQKAYLKVYVSAVTAAGGFNVAQVNGAWSETALTYGSSCATVTSGCYLATNATAIATRAPTRRYNLHWSC